MEYTKHASVFGIQKKIPITLYFFLLQLQIVLYCNNISSKCMVHVTIL